MEYSILGINEGASIEQAEKALKIIRIRNHPDKHPHATEQERKEMRRMVLLAEEAFERLKKKMAASCSQHTNELFQATRSF